MDTRYRLNIDFDNTVVPFLYNDVGTYTFTVPSSPNFMGTRYVVFLPAVLMLDEVGHYPAISGMTRVEGKLPADGEFRTITSANYNELLLKDAIEFNSAQAGDELTLTNFYTVGSTVDPSIFSEFGALLGSKFGMGTFVEMGTGTASDLPTGNMIVSKGAIQVASTQVINLTDTDVAVTENLTEGRWYTIYIDTTGAISFELLDSSATDYTVMPIGYLDSVAPISGSQLGRYKATDSTLRLLALAYSLTTPSTYVAGTTYARGDKVMYTSGSIDTVYISLVASNVGNTPDSSPTYWMEMGVASRIWADKIFNFPEYIFGTGALGDVTLDGTGLGATATPFYANDGVGVKEYEFNNLTITGTCYCGITGGASLNPVVIRVKDTLTIGASGQFNGDSRGANGGSGGSYGSAGSTNSRGGAGGAGARSGRPIHIYANRIVNQRTSGNWLTTQAGNPSGGSNGGSNGGGGGGSGGASSSGIRVISNSRPVEFETGINKNIRSASLGSPGNGVTFKPTSGIFVQSGRGGYGGIQTGGDGEDALGKLTAAEGWKSNTTQRGRGGRGRNLSAVGGLGGGGSSPSYGPSPPSHGTGGGGGAGGTFGAGGGGGGGNGYYTFTGGAGGTGSSPSVSHEFLDYIDIRGCYQPTGGV